VVIGAGGLGGPILYALGAAGVRVRACDPDVVDLSNLQRQVQFTTADVGRPKAAALADEAARRGLDVEAIGARFSADLLDGADVAIDGSDDPATKLAVGDLCVARGLPHVIAGVLRWSGTVFAGAPGAACFRCLFEDAPDDAPTCAQVGVVGAACAVIGGLAARAALALLAGERQDAGSILVIDDLRTGRPPRQVRFGRRPGCQACAQAFEITAAHPS
jgi:molybdopterin/thiamine biosynthesis adenylyltransferase